LRAEIFISSDFLIHQVGDVDRLDRVRVDRNEEAADCERYHTHHNQNQGRVVDGSLVAENILDDHIDRKNCEEGDTESHEESEYRLDNAND
jgi:hypothetical protein